MTALEHRWKNAPTGVYLHVPFCLSKCPYCDFYSLAADVVKMDAYTDALCRAIALGPTLPEVETIYFGGGTPILLGASRLLRIMEALHTRYSIQPGAEITLEANPHAAQLELLQALRTMGINRLSMGLQSSSSHQLHTLGRLHSPEEAAQAVADARKAGFSNISLDVMLGLPDQTAAELAETLRFCAEQSVEHLSAYLLKIEPQTPFAQRYPQGVLDEDTQADLYLQMVHTMEESGYRQYEISNFARPGYESRHNTRYWLDETYLGIGPSAHSFWDGGRFFFPRDLNAFLTAPNPWELAEEEGPGGDFEEYAMLRLRLTEGLIYEDAAQWYPMAEVQALRQRAEALWGHGLLQEVPERAALTPQGMLLSNTVIAHLLP